MKGKGKSHMRAEMGALRKGGASKAMIARERMEDRAEYGYRDGGKIGSFKPCADCKRPNACKSARMCLASPMRP